MAFRNQVTFALASALLLQACVVVTIKPGAMGPVRPWPATASCPVPANTASESAKLVALMNAERAKAGLGALTLSPAISDVAHKYACEIAARQDIGHEGTDGSKLSERLRRGGITANMVAENNAAQYRNAEQVFAAWMASPHHRENILRPQVTQVGIGMAAGFDGTWVADFTS